MAKLVAIQVLRAGAALSVALLHAQHEAGLLVPPAPGFLPSPLLPWEAGVDVFFVISGFVMVFASRGLFAHAGARRTFLLRRIARVAPLYWLMTSLYLAVALASPGLVGAPVTPANVLASYVFWPLARADGSVQPVYSLGWTLNYEMFFYALFALSLGWPRRRAVGLVLLALVSLVALVAATGAGLPVGFWGHPIVLEFAIGAGLGLARVEGLRLGPGARFGLAALGLAAFAGFGAWGADLPRPVVYGVPAGCLVAAAGLARDYGRAGESWPVRLASLLGDASYALYLTHPFAIRGLRALLQAAGDGAAVAPSLFVLAALAAAAMASLGVHLWVERPLNAWARRRLAAQAPVLHT